MKQIDFKSDNILRNILQAMIPMLVAQVLNLLYSIVDRIYIGRIPGTGTSALGGIGLCFPIVVMVTAFTNLFGMGGGPLCSISLGRGEKEKAGRIMNTAFTCLIMTGIVLMIVGEVFASPILTLFGATEGNLPFALAYLKIYLLGTVFTMLATGLTPYINAQGFTPVGMMTVVIGAVSNIILDPIFIFLFHLGIQGAAIATVISQILSAIFALRFLTGKQPDLRLTPSEDLRILAGAIRDPRGEGAEFFATALDIAGLGLAAFIMAFTASLVNIVCNTTLSTYGGELMVSVMTIVSSVRQVLETPVISIVEGSAPVISYNYGAKKPANVRRAVLLVGLISAAYTIIVWFLIERFPAFFIRMFSSDPVLIQAASTALHLYFFAFLFMAFQYTGQITFKALGKKKFTICFSLLRKVILVIPLTILLPALGFGSDGVFMAEPVSNVVGGTACFVTMLLTVLPELKRIDEENARNAQGAQQLS